YLLLCRGFKNQRKISTPRGLHHALQTVDGAGYYEGGMVMSFWRETADYPDFQLDGYADASV
ncbi:MAG: hypothetical protein LIP11_18270, partial [Clostridiales bacterium]|nr:hypothetical protein [Clostridiales bacterium]